MTATKFGEYGRSSFLKLGWVRVVNWGQSQLRMSGEKQKFRMYSNIVVTGEYTWAPSSRVHGGGNCFQSGTNDANIDAVDLEEENGDKKEDINHASDNNITRSDSTSLHMVHQGCSIHEVMAKLHSIPGVLVDDDFHDFASEFLLPYKRFLFFFMEFEDMTDPWYNNIINEDFEGKYENVMNRVYVDGGGDDVGTDDGNDNNNNDDSTDDDDDIDDDDETNNEMDFLRR
uniref:Uncharacterized protein n=1 Tax=Salix viminalis TaxID=40686 RepID=A0A6N2N4J4_SALVM